MQKREMIDAMIDSLRGTTESLDTECEARGLDPMDSELCAQVDEAIFCCTVCGWWCGQDEEASEEFGLDEWTCWDCANEA